MKRGMRTFLMVMIKTLKNKERLRMLRAFNKIFQYGMHMMHERIHFLQNKHADVVDFVRKLRKEMHVGTSSSKLEYDNNREARATGYATSAPPISRATSHEHSRDGPTTPAYPRTDAPIRRGRSYHSHHAPSPPIAPSPPSSPHTASYARDVHDACTRRELLFGRTQDEDERDSTPSSSPHSSRSSPPITLRLSTATEAGQDDFDFTRAFGSWRKAAEKIRRGD